MTKKLIYPTILILLVLAIYSNSVNGQFVFDDSAVILQNPAIMGIRTLSDAVNFSGPRSLLTMTYGLNYYFSGVNPTSYHWTNILIHALNSVLVYFILLQLVESTPTFLAFAGSAVFACHTLATSAVSYISGRSSLLCATFYFISALFLLKCLRPRPYWQTFIYFISAGISGGLAWYVKQEAITLPIFLAAILYVHGAKLRYLIPLTLLPALIALSLRQSLYALYQSTSANQILANAGFDVTLQPIPFFLTYITSLVGYIYPRLLAPISLSIDPEIQPVSSFLSPEFITSLLLITAIAFIAFAYRRSQPLLSLGLFAILLSPISAYAFIPLADPIQEHRAYISILGIALIFTWFLSRFRPYAIQITLILIPFLSILTYARNPVWSSPLTLWTDAAAKSPSSYRPHMNLGAALHESHDWAGALREYSLAISINPNLTAAYSNSAGIQADLGAFYVTSGQPDLALKAFSGAEVSLRHVVDLSPHFPEGWINLAVVLMRQGKFDESIRALTRALTINPSSFPAHYNLAEVLVLQGDFTGAREEYQSAFRLRPDIAITKTKIIETEDKLK